MKLAELLFILTFAGVHKVIMFKSDPGGNFLIIYEIAIKFLICVAAIETNAVYFHCCYLAKTLPNSNKSCENIKDLVFEAIIKTEYKELCEKSLEFCCLNTHQKDECEKEKKCTNFVESCEHTEKSKVCNKRTPSVPHILNCLLCFRFSFVT